MRSIIQSNKYTEAWFYVWLIHILSTGETGPRDWPDIGSQEEKNRASHKAAIIRGERKKKAFALLQNMSENKWDHENTVVQQIKVCCVTTG